MAFRFAAVLSLCTALGLCATLAAAQAGVPGAGIGAMGRKSGAATTSTKSKKPAAAALRSECLDSVGLCISVPAAWQRLGNIFGDLGFVAAEPHPGADPEMWPHLTVAAIDVRPSTPTAGAPGTPDVHSSTPTEGVPGTPDMSAKESDGKASSPSLDLLVERMLTGEGALASAHVLERSSLLLNGADTQIVRVGIPDETGSAEALETVALIEGQEGLVYSIALRCSPPDFSRLEPVFRQALESWHLQSAESTPSSAPATPSKRTGPAASTKPNP